MVVDSSSTPPPRLKGIIFDLGSTLMFFDSNWVEAVHTASDFLVSALISHGVKLAKTGSDRIFLKRFRELYFSRESLLDEYTIEDIIKDLLHLYGFSPIPEELVRVAVNAFYGYTRAHWQVEPDAYQTLDILQREGYHLGIISNAGDDQDVQLLVDKAQIRPFFDFILSSATIGKRKPHPRPFQIALDHWDLLPNEVVMVGDTVEADVAGARNIGMKSIWITRRVPPDDIQSPAVQPDVVIQTLSELPDILENWRYSSSS